MNFTFRPAKLEGVGLFVALAGGSRTGKTFTALRMAKGIAGPNGRIAALDTEGRRMSHYSTQFRFDVADMPSPFAPERFVDAAREAQSAGYDVLVIDSFSLEWSGVGGVLDTFDKAFAAKNHAEKWRDVCWAQAKKAHKRMMNDLIQLTIPLIFCLRANEVPKHLCVPEAEGRWKIEQDKRFLYEWTVGLTLHPDTPGVPRFDMLDAKAKPLWKVQEQHLSLFPSGQLIGEEAGAGLAAWRNSDAARSTSQRRRTWGDWLDELEVELDELSSREAVDDRVRQDDVRKALVEATDNVKARLNKAVAAAIARVEVPPATPVTSTEPKREF